MKYVIFSKLNKNHFLFLSYFINEIIDELCNRYVKTTGDIIEKFHKNYIHTISDFSSIIPIIIIKIRSWDISKNKLIKENNKDSNFNIKYIYFDIEAKNKKKIIKRILIISIFDFFAKYVETIFEVIFSEWQIFENEYKLNSIIIFNIISKYILSILILHSPFYRHHYVSMAINLIFLIILIIIDIIFINGIYLSLLYALVKIIRIILFSFEDVFAKILLSIDSISPFLYLFYRGILVNSLSLLFSIIFIFVKLPDEERKKSCAFSRFWKIYEYKLNILLYFIKFFNGYFMNLNIFFIIDKFSLIHFAMASILENFGSLFLSIFLEKDITIGIFFLKFGLYFILIITALIYSEFIILNFCGLEKYTKLFLQREANNDIQQTIRNMTDDDLFSEDENINQNEMTDKKENSENNIRSSNVSENSDFLIKE